jgi:hypothetical protein
LLLLEIVLSIEIADLIVCDPWLSADYNLVWDMGR